MFRKQNKPSYSAPCVSAKACPRTGLWLHRRTNDVLLEHKWDGRMSLIVHAGSWQDRRSRSQDERELTKFPGFQLPERSRQGSRRAVTLDRFARSTCQSKDRLYFLPPHWPCLREDVRIVGLTITEWLIDYFGAHHAPKMDQALGRRRWARWRSLTGITVVGLPPSPSRDRWDVESSTIFHGGW